MYSVAFPSRRDEITKMSVTKLRELELGLKYFEVDEKEVIKTLIDVIIYLCKTDKLYLSVLKKTRNRKLIYSDYGDKYFGGTKNIYGQCLMKVRNEKLYKQEEKVRDEQEEKVHNEQENEKVKNEQE